jgi:copper chaperone
MRAVGNSRAGGINMAQASFRVQGMTCGHCKAAVEKTLGQLGGVSAVSVNLETKEVKVTYDADKVSTDVFKNAIEDAGYDVEGL